MLKRILSLVLAGLFVIAPLEAAFSYVLVFNQTEEPLYVTPVYKNILGGALSLTVDLPANSGYSMTSMINPLQSKQFVVPDVKFGKQRFLLISRKDIMYKDASTVEKSRGDEQAILVGIGLTTGTGLEKSAVIKIGGVKGDVLRVLK